MGNGIELRRVKTEYRETRDTPNGQELRWILNTETTFNVMTQQAVTRGIVRHPGACVIVPLLDDNTIAMTRQYRYPVAGELWELPAGTMIGWERDGRVVPAETPHECATRELLEEAGFEPGRLDKVGECYATPGLSDELLHIFLARDLTRRESNPDQGELIHEVRVFSALEIDTMIRGGEIRDAKTLVGLFYARRRG